MLSFQLSHLEGKLRSRARTAEITIDLENVPAIPEALREQLEDTIIRTPVTQAVIYGWYDNEMGSYVNMLGDRTVTIAENM